MIDISGNNELTYVYMFVVGYIKNVCYILKWYKKKQLFNLSITDVGTIYELY